MKYDDDYYIEKEQQHEEMVKYFCWLLGACVVVAIIVRLAQWVGSLL